MQRFTIDARAFVETGPTYVFAGGGSGGHLFPGIAVAEELQRRDPGTRVVFVGSGRAVEADIVRRYRFEHTALAVESSTSLRRAPWRFAWRNWQAVRAAGRLIRRNRPRAVVGLGGFASVPVVFAAARQGVPILLLEQNTVPGRATRWLSRYASCLCLSFEEPELPDRTPAFWRSGVSSGRIPLPTRTIVTGNPVRREIAALHSWTKNPGADASGSPQWAECPGTLLILGGSQGAVAVNDMVTEAMTRLSRPPGENPSRRLAVASGTPCDNDLSGYVPAGLFPQWKIVHQTGSRQAAEVRERYARLGLRAEVAPFFSDMASRYRSATLVVTRGGATALAEMACAGCPAVIVPYPNSLGDHQWHNARYYESRGAALIVEQAAEPGGERTPAFPKSRGSAPRTDAERLTAILKELLVDAARVSTMRCAMQRLARPDAAAHVVDLLLEITTRTSRWRTA